MNAYRSAQSKVGYLTYRDTLLYFFTNVTNVIVLIIKSLDSNDNLIKSSAVPFDALTVTMSSRVVLELEMVQQTPGYGQLGLTYSLAREQIRRPTQTERQ